jgi:putative transposase
MRFTYKYRLYPTKAQVHFLEDQLREACSLYNAAKQERDDAWKTCRKSISYYDQANQLKAMRADGCLTLANFSCCQDVLRRVDKTYKAFFARVNRGERPGFPRYRSARRYASMTFPSYGDGCRLLDTGKLRIQGAGHIKVKLHRPVEGTIKTVSIKRDVGHWYVCFSVERKAQPLAGPAAEIGIDVGLDSFAVLSDGTGIDNPRHLHRQLAHLRRCQRKLVRRQRGSNRRRKARVLVAKTHRKIRNQRAAFHHDISRRLVDRYGLIAVESRGCRAECSPVRSMMRVGTASSPSSRTRQHAPDGSWCGWIRAEPARRAFVELPCPKPWGTDGTTVPRAVCRPPAM